MFNTIISNNKTMKAKQLTINGLIIMLMVMAVVLQGCGESKEVQEQSAEYSSVEIIELRSKEATSSKKLSGTLKSETRSEIGTKVIGEVEEVPFSIGSKVQKGAVILRIRDNDLRAKKAQVEAGLEQVKAQMELVEKDYQRYKALHEQGSATDREWDEIQVNYRKTKAQVTSTENQLSEINDLLSYTRVKAPYTGIIAAKYVEEGDIASPGRPLIAIEKEGSFTLVASVPETDIHHISRMDTLPVSIPSAGLDDLLAVVTQVSASGDPMSRQFKIELTILGAEQYLSLRSGMYAEINLIQPAEYSLFVPNTAIVERGQLKGIYVVSSGEEAVLRWITTGSEDKERIELLSGVKVGERIVLNSEAIQFDGQPVRPIN
jgi:RND family efflux transporter MFP subunit